MNGYDQPKMKAENFMGLTLRHKINGAIIVTFLVNFLISGALQIPFLRHKAEISYNGIKVLLKTLVERDMEQLANEIFDSRMKAISIRIRQMKKVDGILVISVFDHDGVLLVSDGDAAPLRNLESKEIRHIRREQQVKEMEMLDQEALQFTKKIEFLGEELGFIRIYYSLEQVMTDQRNTYLFAAGMMAITLLVMLIVLNLTLSRVILHPIRHLRDAAQFLAGGNFENPLDMDRSDELGSLAESFERMRHSIKEKFHDLELLTDIIDSTSDIVSMSSSDGCITYLNRAGRRTMGYPDDMRVDTMHLNDFHPEWANEKVRNLGIPSSIENGTWEGETAILGRDGSEIAVSQVIISHKREDNSLESLSTIVRDISEQKKAEREMYFLRNYLACIIDSMPSVLIGVDEGGDVTQWNAEAARVTGVTSLDALGQPLVEVFPRMSTQSDLLSKALKERRMMSDTKHAYQEKEQERYEDVTVYPISIEGLEGAVIRIDDVTDKVNMEEMMIQSEKMLSVGGLAAGMAHEINNPLAGMIQAASLLTSRLTDTKIRANRQVAGILGISMDVIRDYSRAREIPKIMERLHESGRRASKIVSNMLSFARKSDEGFKEISLVELLEQTLEMAGSDYDLKKRFDFRRIEIIREYHDDIPDISCEPAKIQQVLFNILRNGAEAMQELQETPQGKTEPRFIFRIAYERLLDMVQLEIEDNGPGIDEEIRKRVFEPFFTTKSIGRGTGLGLSVSYFIITENHGGKMSVISQPGQGARFVIQLPVTR